MTPSASRTWPALFPPYMAYELVSALKKELDVPLQLHCHYTSGMASMAYLKAIEAGCDVVDTASSPLALGTSQPPVESLVAALQGTPWDTGLDLSLLSEIANYWKEIKPKYDQFAEQSSGVDTNVLEYQIPGGMISNLASQLRQANALDKYEDCLAEVPRVRAELGYPPGYPHQPDRGHPGRLQCGHGGTLQGGSQGSKELRPWLLRAASGGD